MVYICFAWWSSLPLLDHYWVLNLTWMFARNMQPPSPVSFFRVPFFWTLILISGPHRFTSFRPSPYLFPAIFVTGNFGAESAGEFWGLSSMDQCRLLVDLANTDGQKATTASSCARDTAPSPLLMADLLPGGWCAFNALRLFCPKWRCPRWWSGYSSTSESC